MGFFRLFILLGFVHSAFTFGQESFIASTLSVSSSLGGTKNSHIGGGGNIGTDGTTSSGTSTVLYRSLEARAGAVPPGMLISLLQKGLHYASIEFHLNDDGSERSCSRPFTLLEPHNCDLRQDEGVTNNINDKSNNNNNNGSSKISKGSKSKMIMTTTTMELEGVDESVTEEHYNFLPDRKRKNGTAVGAKKTSTKNNNNAATKELKPHFREEGEEAKKISTKETSESVNTAGKKKKTIDNSNDNGRNSKKMNKNGKLPRIFAPSQIHILKGHRSEVISCAWSLPADPSKDSEEKRSDIESAFDTLASTSGDGTARLWNIPLQGWKSDSNNEGLMRAVLAHGDDTHSPDVTTTSWSPDGRYLATGCYDGRMRIWRCDDGCLVSTGIEHRGPIFQLHWSPSGQFLASAGVDPAVVVWQLEAQDDTSALPNNPFLKKLCVYANHTAPALDVHWRDDKVLASCSSDRQVHIYRPAEDMEQPILVLTGHEDEVNSIRWSPSGHLLLSSSDDHTARIWSVSSDGHTGSLLKVLAEHAQEIYTAKWQPISKDDADGQGPENKLLATASFDSTIRIWNAKDGHCLYTLRYHRQPVYAISFSPDGRYLASGSLDGHLALWQVKGGRLMRTFEGVGGIFEVAWNSRGDKLAACTSEKELIVLDVTTDDELDVSKRVADELMS